MDRREALEMVVRLVAVPAVAGLTPEELMAAGRAVHRRLGSDGAGQAVLRVLDAHQTQAVRTIAEHIVPETDTPGAAAARVEEFIDLLLAEWYDEEDRARFLEGLADVDRRSRTLFGRDFVDAEPAEQVAVLSGLDAEVTALREAGAREALEGHFFQRMKWLTLYGYYTSEVGVEQELKYVTIPGRYDPCAATGVGRLEGE